MTKLELTVLISSLILIFLTFFFKSDLISYYILLPLFLVPLSLVFYSYFKNTYIIDVFVKRFVKYSYENPYQRKRKLVKGAIEGSSMARINIGEIIKEAFERKYNVRLDEETAMNLIGDRDIVALIFYRDHEGYFKDKRRYEFTLKKAIDMVW
ncbi:MAG TPA: hypothetical protein VKU94_04805 [Geobacterales bacterium]|nr:hypothetical protein [Geobacterales bacterium]